MHIDESTHLELINAAGTLAEELEVQSLEVGRPLTPARMAMVNKARDLVRVAKADARLVGILPPGPGAAKS